MQLPPPLHTPAAAQHPHSRRCSVSVTSVLGHVYGLDFEPGTGARDIRGLYNARTAKIVEETSARLGVVEHLRAEAEGCGWLCLWLDCDREGENICFEVLRALGGAFAAERVWRARFSSLAQRDVRGALQRLGKPNAAEAAAVDARQELDLKVGCSFTRLLTRGLRNAARRRFGLPKLRLISFGPCQTPACWFAVQRQREIESFCSQQFWELTVQVSLGGGEAARLRWKRNPCFDGGAARRTLAACQRALTASASLSVESVRLERRSVPPPRGLNTVAMLRMASAALALSPHKAMRFVFVSDQVKYKALFVSFRF